MEESSQENIITPKRWTRFSKGLCILSSVLALAVIGLVAGLIVVSIQRNNADSSQNSELCLTENCIRVSANVLGMMNLTADPCDEFYVFACGGFNATLMPDEQTQRSTFQDIDEKTTEQLRVIAMEPSAINEIQPFRDVKALYQACMNVDAIESLDMIRFDALIAEMGGWPVVLGSVWNEAAWTWEQSVYSSRIHGYSVSNILSFSVTSDNRDATRRSLVSFSH